MTEERFVNKGKDIFQYGEWWCSAGGEHCADVIATALDMLLDENEQLKKEKQYFLKVIFAMGNYAEKGDYERIINARDKVKQRILND